MKKIDLNCLREMFSFLESQYHYSVIKMNDEQFLDIIWIDYEKLNSIKIRIMREKGYYSLKFKIEDEYFESQIIRRFLVPHEKNYGDYRGNSGLKLLISDIKKDFPMLEENIETIRKNQINDFYNSHPARDFEWKE